MPKAYLLRFQEACLVGDKTPDVACGTRTITRVNPGDTDDDPRNTDLHAIPRTASMERAQVVSAGEPVSRGQQGQSP
jgi:hypothetical protein